ncbi:hypothetical protein SSX86_024353 [Deinandra increscens subsp. villosa]|uniref:Uncharacterized protein n=1 Tax=Deinandra increscens subsp. villosa TaxID=3103831 RepID=A0AAP0CMP2_9ASTR
MADHKRKKKRGRSKLFRSCFRSFAAADERPLSNHRKSDDRNTRNGRLGKPVLIAVSGGKRKEFVPDGDFVDGDRSDERPSYRRSVSQLIKSVMVKKIRSSSKSSIASETNESFQSIEKTGNECGTESTDIEDSSASNLLSSSSRATSSSYASSSSSSKNSNSQWSRDQIPSNVQKPNLINSSSQSRSDQKSSSQTDSIDPNPNLNPNPNRTNSVPRSSSYNKRLSHLDSVDSSNFVSSNYSNYSNPDKLKSGCNSLNIRWCLFLLLSLIVLVTYGRIYSILCTSIWFYLVPCRRRLKRVNSVSNAAGFVDTESEQYKKRVIMAGLLDRTRNPLR